MQTFYGKFYGRNIYFLINAVGKGTFAKLICARHNWIHSSLGQVFRREVQSESALGKLIESSLKDGKLISDDIANHTIKNFLYQHRNSAGVILDGYPRTVRQAEFLFEYDSRFLAVNISLERTVSIEKLLARYTCINCNREFNKAAVMRDGYDMPAILPDASTCPLKNRCVPELQQRDDDRLEVIRNRLDEYQANVGPLLEFYKSKQLLREFGVHKGVKDVDDLYNVMIGDDPLFGSR